MSKIQDEFRIVSKHRLTETCFDLSIYCPELAKIAQAGQFIHISCGEKTLRRPISVCQTDKDKGIIRIVFEIRGEGTLWLSKRKEGEFLNILGPLGNGFPTDKNKKALLIGGGIGVPPLLECSKCFSPQTTSILGFRSKDNAILIDDFKKYCREVYITTEDGTVGTKGFVTDVLNDLLTNEAFDIICACGPLPMLKAVSRVALGNSIECYISLEERMACGVGACLGCACKTIVDGKEGYSHVCKNGPVFNAQEVV